MVVKWEVKYTCQSDVMDTAKTAGPNDPVGCRHRTNTHLRNNLAVIARHDRAGKAARHIVADNFEMKMNNLELVRARPPDKYILAVSKVVHILPRIKAGTPSAIVDVGGGMAVSVQLTLPPGVEYVTTYDMAVYAAVQSLHAEENEMITISMICRAMCGNLDASNLGDKIKQEVTASIHRLMATHITIDATAQKDKYQLDRAVYADRLLNLRMVTARNDCGQACVHYRFVTAPVLYAYSMAVKHIYAFAAETVRAPTISNTHAAIVMRYCLLRRVAIINRDGGDGKIAYDTLLKEAGCADACKDSKTTRSRCRRLIRRVLEHLVAQGEIGRYQEYKLHRKFAGVRIIATKWCT